MLTSHLTWKRIFEKNAVFWAWCSQNTAKFHTACLKKGSKLGEIGPISAEKWCRWCAKPFGIISEHKKISKKFHFFDPHTHTDPPPDPSCVVISGSEIGLYLEPVDTSEARIASKNTFYIRIYSKNTANSIWELDVDTSHHITSDVETYFREKRCFLRMV